ncbi:MAG: hypothetical protein BYD32DRAFT_424676 [Podila humilis]|nr:MAG: hypothetical protein BYD32DRAFT_424676 [Podila humilis]
MGMIIGFSQAIPKRTGFFRRELFSTSFFVFPRFLSLHFFTPFCPSTTLQHQALQHPVSDNQLSKQPLIRMPDFICPGLNPLSIPELIAIVGQFIPICKQELVHKHNNLYFYPPVCTMTTVFAPQDLLACTAVSRTWRRILLPILWRSYDGTLMRAVPLATIRQNSVYFRAFRDYLGHHHQGPFASTNLRSLVISHLHGWANGLISSNPNLQSLTYTGVGGAFPNFGYRTFVYLSRLQDLCLSNWNMTGRQLAFILCGSPRLIRLGLSFLEGIQDLEGMTIMFGIEEISLGYIPNSGQKLLQLIQYLPSLQRISFLGTWIDQSTQQRDIITLSSSLRFFCPELRSIHTTAAYNFASNEYDTLDDSELASLIQSTKALEHFKVEVASLGRLMSDSLITQYESLVAVDLCIRRRNYRNSTATPGCVRSSDILNTARILSSCCHLRVFRLSSAVTIDVNAALQLFTSPWACLGLEILWLSQISVPAATTKQDRRSTLSSSSLFSQYGWSVQSNKQHTTLPKLNQPHGQTQSLSTQMRTLAPPGSSTTPSGRSVSETEEDLWAFGTEFPKKLLPQIGRLSVLKELCLNKVQYSRSAYM